MSGPAQFHLGVGSVEERLEQIERWVASRNELLELLEAFAASLPQAPPQQSPPPQWPPGPGVRGHLRLVRPEDSN